jgi:hypothetical protein
LNFMKTQKLLLASFCAWVSGVRGWPTGKLVKGRWVSWGGRVPYQKSWLQGTSAF